MQSQRCPNCQKRNDVSVYVHGQLAKCVQCGIRFTVDREKEPERLSQAPRVEAPPPAPAPPPMAPEGPTEVYPPKVLTTEEIAALQEDSQAPKPAPAKPAEVRAPTPPKPPEPRPTAPETPDAKADANGEPKPNIPGYVVETLLGRGGMGEVWRARQVSLGRVVALKLLSPTLAVERDFIRRFERESNALAALQHPNVVQVFDRGEANGLWYFTMEYVEGRSLRDKHADTPLSRAELLKLVAQVARAVDYAHRKNIIHRDLKPENILVDHQNNAKVADFGLAGMSEVGRSSLTMTAVAMGTAHYMAPEQRKDAKNVDRRADLYSLGVMLYELMTGELPVGRFKTPREKVPDLDQRLDAMILRLLEEDPKRRPDRAEEVAQLLESLTSGPRPELLAPAPPAGPRALSSVVRGIRASPLQKGLFGGALALLIAVLGIAVWHGPSEAADQWFAAKVDRAGNGATIAFGAGAAESVLASGGGWEVSGTGLSRRATTPAQRPSRAYLMPLRLDLANAQLEADLVLEDTRGMSEAPGAEIVLYVDNDEYVGVKLHIGEDASSQVFYSTPKLGAKTLASELEPDPRPGKQHHLALFLIANRLSAMLDGRQVGAVSVSGLAGGKAKIGLGCRVGSCKFTNVKVAGTVLDVAASASASKGSP